MKNAGEEFPEFSGEGEVGDAGDGGWGAIAFAGKSGDEVPVHDDVAAVGVEVALGELHGLADHDAHGDGGDSFLVGCAKGVADVVAVVNEGLRREVGEARAEIVLALGTGVDDEPGAAEGVGYLYLFAYGVDEGLGRKGTDDAGGPDDGDAAGDAELGVECFQGEFATSGHGDTDGDARCDVMGAEELLDFASDHGAGGGVDGGFSNGDAEAGECDRADSLAGKESHAG